MDSFVRRSNLMVPLTVKPFVEGCWRHDADAITLDLEDGVPQARKREARELVKEAITEAGRGGAEVFVRVNKPYLYVDLEASVWLGLSGIMLPKVGHGEEVRQASDLLADLEPRRGLESGSLQLILLLESAMGIWNVREIVTASPRVTQVALGESDLACNLDISMTEELDPLIYAKGRIVIEATAAKVQPVGMAHPMGALPRLLPQDEILRLATMAKNLGFKGVICPHPSWVEPVNKAFTPTQEQVEYYKEVRRVFAEGVARGTAAVPLRGRMIDVPVDEWAKKVLEWAEMCSRRQEEKKRALEL